ncbi:retrovirus-related Pol polyprotein from transposon 412 [Trichonephila clavipes]|nr:retrovirus-related Pol polyprotein from transposon 412 [Trichonephila clavipes]
MISYVKDWNWPTDLHQLQSFLDLCTYYGEFVKDFSTIGRPLHKLTENRNSSGRYRSRVVSRGQECDIAYFSKCLSKPERNYCVPRKELLAIVKTVQQFHTYLYGRRFLLRADHASLTWLLNFKNSEGQKARWIQRLQEYDVDVEIRHRKGSAHGYADALSRRPCPESCKYCARESKRNLA